LKQGSNVIMAKIESEFENGLEPSLATWSAVRHDLETLGADIVKLGETSLNGGQELVAQETQRLRAVLADLITRVDSRGRSSLGDLTEYVTKRPITSVAVAFSAGLFLAMLSGRRR